MSSAEVIVFCLMFCWLIHLINPINYFGDFHNTLQSSSCTMCRVQILTYLSKDSSWSVMFAPLILICCQSSVIVLDLLFSRTWLDVLFTPSVHNLCRYEHHEKVSYINMVQSKIFSYFHTGAATPVWQVTQWAKSGDIGAKNRKKWTKN